MPECLEMFTGLLHVGVKLDPRNKLFMIWSRLATERHCFKLLRYRHANIAANISYVHIAVNSQVTISVLIL